jgi:hypothetical protein
VSIVRLGFAYFLPVAFGLWLLLRRRPPLALAWLLGGVTSAHTPEVEPP